MIIIEKYSCYTSSKIVVLAKKKTKIDYREIDLQKWKIQHTGLKEVFYNKSFALRSIIDNNG